MLECKRHPLGKIDTSFFQRAIRPRLGQPRPSVLVGPQHGVDVGVVGVAPGKVLATTTDPFYVVPAYGWQRAGWFAVHILASDLTTSGLAPQYMSIDLNLPPSMSDDDIDTLWQATDKTCKELGIAVITGHTGRYMGCDFPMVGGCTLFAIGEECSYITTRMARANDVVIVTKGCAIEAAGLMAVTFPEQVATQCGTGFAQQAQELFWQMSTVEDALTSVSVGVRDDGVTTMHDATECGVFGGLCEVAEASGVGMQIQVDQIPIREDVQQICTVFGMDPYTSISEGTLILTSRPHKADAVVSALAQAGILARVIGECIAEPGVTLIREKTQVVLEHPRVDPFWAAFERATKSVRP